MSSAAATIEYRLQIGKVALAERVIGILPREVPFYDINTILLEYSCPQYNGQGEPKETGVLTEALRNALVAKSTRPSLKELQDYYGAVGYELYNHRISENYREVHFDVLNRLLRSAQLQPDKIGEFISSTLRFDEWAFIEPLVAKYEGQLTPQSKVKILNKLLPSHSTAHHQKRTHLFTSWMHKWRPDVLAQAHEVYAYVSEIGDFYVERCPSRVAGFNDPTEENLQAANTRFKQILIDAFPGCDQAPQAKAV